MLRYSQGLPSRTVVNGLHAYPPSCAGASRVAKFSGMAAGFTFDTVWIVESLEPHELQTGRLIRDHLVSILPAAFTVEYVRCQHVLEFDAILERIMDAIRVSARIPLLHVECHGDLQSGLEFANGSGLQWRELADRLRTINMASRFNLVAVFSACFGGYFLEQIKSIGPAACYALIAPTGKVDPGQILGVLRRFYTELFRARDLGRAIATMHLDQMSHGEWFGQVAETWFVRQIAEYARVHCSPEAVEERVKRLYAEVRLAGNYRSKGHIRRQIRGANRQSLIEELFSHFFMLEDTPSNRQRFAGVQKRIRSQVSDLRQQGHVL